MPEEKPLNNGEESFLRRLRAKFGVSQRELSEKSGISRGRLRRLENGDFLRATYGELKKIGEALGVDLKEIVQGEDPSQPETSIRRRGDSIFLVDVLNGDCKVTSFHPLRPELFMGKLFLAPKKSLESDRTPQAHTIFLQTLLGELVIEKAGEEHQLGESESVLFRGNVPYILKNPGLREAVALLVTVPSFSLNL